VVVYNPSRLMLVCQSFLAQSTGQSPLTTFDVTKANANDPADSHGLGASAAAGGCDHERTSPGTQKGSNGVPDHEAGTVDTGTGSGTTRLAPIAWAGVQRQGRHRPTSPTGQRRAT
jgi:hypothetical protein